MNKLVRGIPPETNKALVQFAPRQSMPNTQPGKERPGINDVIVHTLNTRALDSPYWYQVAEIEHLATQIAQMQRQSSTIQESSPIYEKLIKERRELATLLAGRHEVVDRLSRSASVVYYLSCRFLHNYEIATFYEEMAELATQTGIREELLMLLCLTKFRIRAARQVTNKQYESDELLRCKANYEFLAYPETHSKNA